MKTQFSTKRLLAFVLSLAMLVGMVPMASLTAYAYDNNPYTSLVNTTTTVTFNGKPWYIIADNSTAVDKGTVTLLAADTSFGTKAFDSINYKNTYSTSEIKSYLDGLTNTGGSFEDVADAIETVKVKGSDTDTEVDAKLYLLSTGEAQALSSAVLKMNFSIDMGRWWLRSPGDNNIDAAFVLGSYGAVNPFGNYVGQEFGVLPALQLDLSKVTFDSESKTFSVGSAPALDPVSYMDWNGTELVEKTGDDACKSYTVVTSDMTTTWGTGWYVVPNNSTVTINSTVEVTGDAHLILCDGATLTFAGESEGIHGGSDTSLTIYAQSTGADMGKLETSVSTYSVTINGGDVSATATGGYGDSYGIVAYSGIVTIGGDEVSVTASSEGIAIKGTVKNAIAGTGWTDAAGTTGKAIIAVSTTGQTVSDYKKVQFPVVIDPIIYLDWNGTELVEKTGDDACKDYIEVTGSTTTFENGKWYVVKENVTIRSRISVNGTANLILLDGKTLNASNGITVNSAALKIYEGWIGTRADSYTVGTLNAGAPKYYSGIGGVDGSDGNPNCGTITINGGIVKATGNGSSGGGGAGIGGGYGGQGGNVTINGGIVTANGGYRGAGIGGGTYGQSSGSVTINGGVVTANGNTGAAGIGGGFQCNGASVTVNGGTVTANGGDSAPGIGAGNRGSGNGSLTIADGLYLYGGNSPDPQMGIDKVNNSYERKRYMAVKNVEPHRHDMEYSAEGGTITARCSNSDERCYLTDCSATLTIVKPKTETYNDGKNTKATLTGLADFNTATGLNVSANDIKYVGRDGTTYDESTEAPTNAGKYTATITIYINGVDSHGLGSVVPVTASVDYEIAKAEPTFDVPAGFKAVVGDTLATVTLPDGWTWADDTITIENKGINTFKATFTPEDTANYNIVENNDIDVYAYEYHEEVPVECEKDGVTAYYEDGDGNKFSDLGETPLTDEQTVIEKLGHSFINFLKWVWDGFNNAVAWLFCDNNPDHVETIDVPSQIDTIDEPTCTEDGYKYYVATIDVAGKIYTSVNVETVDQLGHKWGETTYTWSDDNSECTAERACTRDAAHTETEKVKTTYEVITPATCEEDGLGRYMAVFENEAFETQTKDITLEKLGHEWTNPVWNWTSDTKASVTLTCAHDPTHTKTVDAAVGVVVTEEATEEKDGVRTYTAKVTVDGVEYTTTRTETIPKIEPAPDVPTPDVPTPDVPTPDVPTPDEPTPDKPTPDEPTPDKPTPNEPTPDKPTPDEPTPDKPTPDEPTPDKPTPDEPTPDKPTPDEPTPIEVGLLGDVNNDGQVDSADALLILRNSVGLEEFDDTQKILGDVNEDGEVDSADALDVLRYSVQLSANEKIGKPVTKAA